MALRRRGQELACLRERLGRQTRTVLTRDVSGLEVNEFLRTTWRAMPEATCKIQLREMIDAENRLNDRGAGSFAGNLDGKESGSLGWWVAYLYAGYSRLPASVPPALVEKLHAEQAAATDLVCPPPGFLCSVCRVAQYGVRGAGLAACDVCGAQGAALWRTCLYRNGWWIRADGALVDSAGAKIPANQKVKHLEFSNRGK